MSTDITYLHDEGFIYFERVQSACGSQVHYKGVPTSAVEPAIKLALESNNTASLGRLLMRVRELHDPVDGKFYKYLPLRILLGPEAEVPWYALRFRKEILVNHPAPKSLFKSLLGGLNV